MEMEEQLERMRSLRHMRQHPPGQGNPYEQLDRVQDDMAIRKARGIHRAAMAARRGTFIFSMTLIVLGFALQIAGAWPGCCPPWIAPQN
jgi:hypothetical protein